MRISTSVSSDRRTGWAGDGNDALGNCLYPFRDSIHERKRSRWIVCRGILRKPDWRDDFIG